jgi:hypothetical protein
MQIALVRSLFVVAALAIAGSARAQTPPAHRWNIDFGIGWDNSLSGNITSGAIGSINGQSVVFLKNTYDDVYGTGLHLHGGVGYFLDDVSEFRVVVTFQSLGADLTRLGDIGVSNLYGQFDDYQSVGIDAVYRRYVPIKPTLRVYGEGGLGVVYVDRLHADLVAPSINYQAPLTFYDRSASFAVSIDGGVMFEAKPQVDVFAQLGIRYVTGLAASATVVGVGLENVNQHSARWSVPFTLGVRYRF